MASIPAEARKLIKALARKGIAVEYTATRSPGASHDIYLRSNSGKSFVALVERSGVAIWDTANKGGNTFPYANAVAEIERIRNSQ